MLLLSGAGGLVGWGGRSQYGRRGVLRCLDVCYATNAENVGKVLEGLDRFGQLPAIVFGSDTIVRQGPKAFADDFLEALFGGGIAIDGCDPPMQFLPFDLGSRDATVARAVLTQVLADLRAGRGPMTFDDFMEEVVPVWKLIGPEDAKGLCDPSEVNSQGGSQGADGTLRAAICD